MFNQVHYFIFIKLLKLLSAFPPFSFRPVNCGKNSADLQSGLREFIYEGLLSEQRTSVHFDWLVFGMYLPFFMPLINWLKRRINDNFGQWYRNMKKEKKKRGGEGDLKVIKTNIRFFGFSCRFISLNLLLLWIWWSAAN